MDKLFKALNDPTRRRILERLRAGEMTAGEIAGCFSISKPTISHHLDLLKQANLIVTEKQSQFVVCSLNTSVLDECVAWLLQLSEKSKKGSRNESAEIKKRTAATADSGRAFLRRRSVMG
jgi:DNA-binding transcriptional ArsR family regulator